MKKDKYIMKAFVFCFFMISVFNSFALVSSTEKTKIVCYTVSCCSIGPITVEVWSETTCYYYSQQKNSKPVLKTTFYFKEKKPKSDYIEITKDMFIAGLKDSSCNLYLLPKGKYELDDSNSIIYSPTILAESTTKVKKHCITKVVDGSVFGHHYHYEIEISISFSFGKQSNGELYYPYELDLNLTKEQIEKVKNGDNIFTLYKDTTMELDGEKIILKGGKYQIAENGKIYFYN